MVPYIIVFLLVFACSFFDLIKIKKALLFIGLIIMLGLFEGTRLVGPDFYTYLSFFRITPPVSFLAKEFAKFTAMTLFEPGFLLLTGVFQSLGLSFFSFNLFFAAAFLFLFARNLRHYTVLPFTALLVFTGFVYMTSFSAIRQIMAAAIFFYSLRCLTENHPKKYFWWIIVASLFHISALCLLVFYFTRGRRVKSQYIMLIISALLILMFTGFFHSIASDIIKLIPFFPNKMQMYLNERIPFWGSVSLFWIMTLLICFFFRQRLESIDKNFNLFFNILWIGFAIYIVATGFGGFGRILLFFKLGFVVILPLFVILIKEFYGKVMVILGLGLISALLFFSAIWADTRYSPVNRYLPYKTWLIHDQSALN